MARPPVSSPNLSANRIAALSAVIGLLAALIVAAASHRLGLDDQAAGATVPGAFAFIIAFAAPFFAALLSFLLRHPAARRAVWLASGILSLALAVLTIFSGVWLLFGPAGVGLIAAWRLARTASGALGPTRSPLLTGWLLLWLGAALWAVLFLRHTPACWQPTGWLPGTSGSACLTDIIDTVEGLVALAAVAIGLTGMAVLGRAGRPARPAGSSPAPEHHLAAR